MAQSHLSGFTHFIFLYRFSYILYEVSAFQFISFTEPKSSPVARSHISARIVRTQRIRFYKTSLKSDSLRF